MSEVFCSKMNVDLILEERSTIGPKGYPELTRNMIGSPKEDLSANTGVHDGPEG